MRISVLIPTHNRPKLFERAIKSVITAYNYHPVDLEILVNNDSDDITPIHHKYIPIKYFYEKSDNLSHIYKHLFDEATGDYVYVLEDDDIMLPVFFKTMDQQTADVIYANYIPYKVTQDYLKFHSYASNTFDSKDEFMAGYDEFHFQFGQICFRKSALPDGAFPRDNTITNDFAIFEALRGTFVALPTVIYRQTVDGHDNISFKAYNKDPRWNTQ